jgi:PAS domain S-box-containing protein
MPGGSPKTEGPAALHEAEARFRAAFEHAPIGMALLAPDGRFLQVNSAMCDVLGRAEAELLATSWQDVTRPPETQEALDREVLAGQRQGYVAQDRYLRPDGSEAWALLSRSVVRDQQDRPLYFVAQILDVTELAEGQAELARQTEELSALHETTLDLIRRLEPTSLLEAILSRAAALMRTEHAYLYEVDEGSDELVARVGLGRFTDLPGRRLRRGEGLVGQAWKSGQPVAVDDYHAWPGRLPEFDWMRATVALPLYAGPDIVGVIGLVHAEEGSTFGPELIDLLTRFGRLASLALDNARLYQAAQQELYERRRAEKELELSASELRQANEDLRVADEMKSHFVAVASHELRTPLTAVLGFATTLLNHWEQIPDEEKRDQIRTIEVQARRLSRLADDLLTMSKIEAGALEVRPETVDVAPAISRATSTFGDREIEVEVQAGLRVRADPDHLEQILMNYVSNAMRYGMPPVRIDARTRDRFVEIVVADSGSGVPQAFVPHLFEEFSQAGGGGTGTGLGLSIVLGLARAQGGDAWYEPGEPGARFCVRIPSA